jgi:hypothetical protein
MTFLDISCDPGASGQMIDVIFRVSADQGLLYSQMCERPPGEDWECDDTTEMLGPLHGDLISDVWHENDVWFEPCLHVEHGSHDLIVTGTTIRGAGTVSARWQTDDPQSCNDASGEDLPCTEQVEVDLERCVDCWPPD